MDAEDTVFPGLKVRFRDFSVKALTFGGKPVFLDTFRMKDVVF